MSDKAIPSTLAETQKQIAKCLTSPSTIPCAVQSTLQGFSVEELSEAAKTLRRRRLSRLRRLLPLSAKAIGQEFTSIFGPFLDDTEDSGPLSPLHELETAVRWLRKHQSIPSRTIELVDWEFQKKCGLAANWAFRLRRYRYHFASSRSIIANENHSRVPSELWILLRINRRGGFWQIW